jgi:DNA repair protein RadD
VNHEAPKLLECSQCSALRLAGQKCPHCGFLPKRPPRDVPTAPGELGLYAGGRAQSNGYDGDTRTRWHGMFTHIANERGYKPGWIAHKFKEKFGAFPPWGSKPEPMPPSPEVWSWVRSRTIAFAKSRTGT